MSAAAAPLRVGCLFTAKKQKHLNFRAIADYAAR
jgi:hypothetical protein